MSFVIKHEHINLSDLKLGQTGQMTGLLLVSGELYQEEIHDCKPVIPNVARVTNVSGSGLPDGVLMLDVVRQNGVNGVFRVNLKDNLEVVVSCLRIDLVKI